MTSNSFPVIDKNKKQRIYNNVTINEKRTNYWNNNIITTYQNVFNIEEQCKSSFVDFGWLNCKICKSGFFAMSSDGQNCINRHINCTKHSSNVNEKKKSNLSEEESSVNDESIENLRATCNWHRLVVSLGVNPNLIKVLFDPNGDVMKGWILLQQSNCKFDTAFTITDDLESANSLLPEEIIKIVKDQTVSISSDSCNI